MLFLSSVFAVVLYGLGSFSVKLLSRKADTFRVSKYIKVVLSVSLSGFSCYISLFLMVLTAETASA